MWLFHQIKTYHKQELIKLKKHNKKTGLSRIKFLTAFDYYSYSKEELYSFLNNGGIIINNSSVKDYIIKTFFEYNHYINEYNSCIYLKDNSINVFYFNLNYYSNDQKIELSNDNYSLFIQDIINELDNNIAEYSLDTEIYNNSIQHIIYKDNSTTKMCSYTIKTQIIKTQLTHQII